MKRALAFLGLIGMLAGMTACAYPAVAVGGADGSKAIVPLNNAFLFGMMRKVAVCDITDGGLSNCQEGDSP